MFLHIFSRHSKWEPNWIWALLYNDLYGLDPLNEAMSNHMAFNFFLKRCRTVSCLGQANDSHYSIALKTTSIFTYHGTRFSGLRREESRCPSKTMLTKMKVCSCNEVEMVPVLGMVFHPNLDHTICCLFFLKCSVRSK